MGLPSLLLPVTITDSNKWIDLNYVVTGDASASIATGKYADMIAVLSAFQVAVRALGFPWEKAIFTTDDNGHVYIDFVYTISANIEWATGAHTGSNCGTIFGFDVSSDDSGYSNYTSDWQHQRGWYPERALHSYGPWQEEHIGSEKARVTLSSKNLKVLTVGWRGSYPVQIEAAPAYNMIASEAIGAYLNMDLESVYKEMIEGQYGRWREDRSVPAVVTDVYLVTPKIFNLVRTYREVERYSFKFDLMRKES